MNLTKKLTAWFLTLVMVLGLIPQTVFAQETAASLLQYEVTQEVNEDKTEAMISIKFTETETIQLEKVTLPDGTEKVEDLSEVTYTVSENGKYDFKVNYVKDDTPQEETIPVEVSGLEEKKAKEVSIDENNEAAKQKVDSTSSKEVNPKSIKYIHLNSHDGDDQNDGLTEESSVKTFAKAKSLLQDGDIILIDSYVAITQDETWDLKEFPNSKVQRNCSANMIVIGDKASLVLSNIRIDGSHHEGIVEKGFESIIRMGKQKGNENNSSNLTLNLGTILENNINTRGYGGAINANSYNKITINNGAIIQNNGTLERGKAPIYGGAINLENNSELIMNGGTIHNNHAVTGGAVSIIASSMIMNGGSITNNSANNKDSFAGHYGGAICLRNYAGISGAPSHNIEGEASFTMTDGTISGNEATYSSSNGDNGLGGAIATLPDFAHGHEHDLKITINITGGDIIGNTAINGGAISAYFDAVNVTVSNANISNNEAKSQGGAIYGVFNSKINLENTVISQNKASIGAGVYLHSSEMQMNSGDLKVNTATSAGGGIYIDNGSWNNKTAKCTILGGTISGNKANSGRGSDGIYQNSKLNIGEKASINKDNDVYLPSGRVIDVIKPLENITQENSVSITSEDCVVEDEQNKGTRLVNYHDEAGGIKAAENAEYQQLYIPSSYMQEGLVIGKSQAEDQLNYMTYVQKEKYPVTYEFVNGTDEQKLPKEVTDLLPVDDNKYIEGATINASEPNKTEVTVSDGIWVFKGYDANSKLSSADNLNEDGYIQFTGTWEFKKNASILNQIPVINAEDKTIYVGDEFDPLKDVTATDKEDGNITLTIENVIKNEVDNTKVGVYEVTYKVTDSQGASTIKTIKVTVIAKDAPIVPNEPDNPNKPNDSNKPIIPDTSVNDKNPLIPDTSVNDKNPLIPDTSVNDKNPQTGDSTNMTLWALLFITSSVGLVGIYRKKRKTNQ